MSTSSKQLLLYYEDNRAKYLLGHSSLGWGAHILPFLSRNALRAVRLTSTSICTAVDRRLKPNIMIEYTNTTTFKDHTFSGASSYPSIMKLHIVSKYILICATNNGYIAVLDSLTMQIVQLYACGFLRYPIDVVTSSTGNIIVSNYGNLEILVFKSLEDPTIIARIKYGIAQYLTIIENTLAVTDTSFGQIYLYDTTDYTLVHTIHMSSMWDHSKLTHSVINFPVSIVSIPADCSPTGEPLLAVTDNNYKFIQIISMDGKLVFVLKTTFNIYNSPYKTITHHNGEIFLTGYNKDTYYVVSFNLYQHGDKDATLPTGCIILTEEHTVLSGKRGTGHGEFDTPCGIAVTSDQMLVANQCQLFDIPQSIISFSIM